MPSHLTLVADNRRPAAPLHPEGRSRPDAVAPSERSRLPERVRYPERAASSGSAAPAASAERSGGSSSGEQGSRPSASAWVHAAWRPRRAALSDDRGAVTAEYALVIMAGVAFAAVLVAIMRSGEVRQMLVDLVQNALGAAG